MLTPEERFNNFINKFAESRGVKPEDLMDLAVVKEYKEWVVKECADYDYQREKEILETIQTSCR